MRPAAGGEFRKRNSFLFYWELPVSGKINGNKQKGKKDMYEKVSTNLNFVDREKNVGKFWRNQKIFEKSMKARED